MKFKNTILILLACSSLAGLNACDDVEYNAMDAGKVAVAFVPQIGETATRAVNQTWSASDKVGIAMITAGQALPTGSTFSQYQVSGAGTSVSLAPVADAQTLYYPANGDNVNFIAFSPLATVTNNTVTYSALADQSTQAKMEAVDFLYHKGSTAYNKTSSAAALAFNHKLSKLVINVATSAGTDKVTLSGLGLKINGTPAAVTANLADGSITAGAKAAITPYLTGTTTRAATAILVPHAATTGRSITFTVTEGTYTYTIPNADAFEANKAYTLDFTLTKSGVALTAATILTWAEGSMDWEKGYALEAPKEMAFTSSASSANSLAFRSNYGGTLKVVLSTDATNPTAGAPSWITSTGTLTVTPATNYTSYSYSFSVTDNSTLGNAARTAYAHIADAANTSLAAVAINQEGNPIDLEPSSNSYIVKAGSKEIFIPVSRANEYIAGAIGASDVLTAEVLWSEVKDLVTAEVVGSGANGAIKVITTSTSSAAGNAVVAVKVGETIKWSWHIWVTDYEPTGQVMDRNLGATSGTKTDGAMTLGLFYQWGRKDPFPRPASIESITQESTIYTPSAPDGSIYTIRTSSSISPFSTEVIADPLLASTLLISRRDMDSNNLPWKESGNKGVMDPCPIGYRVMSYDKLMQIKAEEDSSYELDPQKKGVSFSVKNGGWYPSNGYRNNKMSLVQDSNIISTFLSSTNPSPTDQTIWQRTSRLRIDQRSINYSTQTSASMYAVRCVSE